MKSLDLKGYKNLTGKELMSGLNFGMRTHDVLASSLSSLNLTGTPNKVRTRTKSAYRRCISQAVLLSFLPQYHKYS